MYVKHVFNYNTIITTEKCKITSTMITKYIAKCDRIKASQTKHSCIHNYSSKQELDQYSQTVSTVTFKMELERITILLTEIHKTHYIFA